MQNKSLLEILQEKIDEHLCILHDLMFDSLRTIKCRIKARMILGATATPAEVSELEVELMEQAKKSDELAIRKENYYLKVISGLLDMMEAVACRYDCFTDDVLTGGMLDTLSELFYNGKHTLLIYSRWLRVIEEDAFTKDWPDIIEPIHFDTFKTSAEWMEFFDKLPIE